tara:strand:+ start:168 stop:629 length:462 start_codon:yes stop_codon:yes gene_type:complete
MSVLGAAASLDVDMRSIKEVEKKLKKLPVDFQRNVARKAMRRGLSKLRKEARDKAPKDTGRLRKAIKTSVSLKSNGDIIGKAFVKYKGKGAAPYAHLVEWGGESNTPTRFMTRTFENNISDFFEAYRELMLLEMQKMRLKESGGKGWRHSGIS